MGLLWELRQNRKIRGAESAATAGATQAAMVETHVKQLETRIAKLAMVCQALWSLLMEQSDLKDEDLLKRVSQLEAQTKQSASEVAKAPPCPKCKRPMPKNGRCLYCGATVKASNAFDKVF